MKRGPLYVTPIVININKIEEYSAVFALFIFTIKSAFGQRINEPPHIFLGIRGET